jgi:hypothetical protein
VIVANHFNAYRRAGLLWPTMRVMTGTASRMGMRIVGCGASVKNHNWIKFATATLI